MEVYLLEVSKLSLFDKRDFKGFSHEVGESVDDLLFFIFKKYECVFEDLIKDEKDDFPYFTDGGFRYNYRCDRLGWIYTFTCFKKQLLSY